MEKKTPKCQIYEVSRAHPRPLGSSFWSHIKGIWNILENCLCQPYFWKLFDFSGVGLIGYFLVLLMGHREEDSLSPH